MSSSASASPSLLARLGPVCIGAVCLTAGVLIGGAWTRSGAHVYTSPPDVAPAAHRVPTTFADVVERVGPGVVTVLAMIPAVENTDAESSARSGVRGGSGFVFNDTGLVLTARHLCLHAYRIVVEIPRCGRYGAELVGEDPVTDLAVLRITNPPPNLTALELGNSEDLRAGDWIVAVGNPYGFRQTVTAGVVSFVDRHLRQNDIRVSSDFLQFSAQVNPGSSGSPIVDLGGRVVGLTTQALELTESISFAIPSRTLKWVLDEMDRSEDGRVHRGHLGITFDSRTDVDEDGRPMQGAVIYDVAEGAAADSAGVRCGDIVLLFDDHQVAGSTDLYERITRTIPGTRVELTLMREGHLLEPIAVVLGDHCVGADGDLVR